MDCSVDRSIWGTWDPSTLIRMYSADGLLEEKGDELFLSAFLFSLKKVAEDDELLA